MALEGPFQIIASRESLLLTLAFFGGYLYVHYLRNEYGPKMELKQLDILIHSSITSTIFFFLLVLFLSPLMIVSSLSPETMQPIIVLGILLQGMLFGYILKIDGKISEFISKFNQHLNPKVPKISEFILSLTIALIITLISALIDYFGFGSFQNMSQMSEPKWFATFVASSLYIYIGIIMWDFFVYFNRHSFQIDREK